MAQPNNQTHLGALHYRDKAGQSMFARVAVLRADRARFDEAISPYHEARGEALLWSEDVFEAVEWLKRFGHNGVVTGLSKAVSEANPVAISEGKAEAGADESYLKIEGIENVEPLDNQFGLFPFKLSAPYGHGRLIC